MSTIQLRGMSAAQWMRSNPILAAREPGLETDTSKIKYGNGTLPWSALPYGGESASDDCVSEAEVEVMISEGIAQHLSDADHSPPTEIPEGTYATPDSVSAQVDGMALLLMGG